LIDSLLPYTFMLWNWLQPIAADETRAFLHPTKPSLSDGDDSQHIPMKSAETDSYTNLYEVDVPLGGSAHSLRNQLVGPGSPHHHQQVSSKSRAYGIRADGHGVVLTSPERSGAPSPYDYPSSRGIRQVSPHVSSPPASYRGQVLGATKGGSAVLASDEKYPLMPAAAASSYSQPSSQASTGGSPLLTRTKGPASVGLPRYGSPTFPPPTARDGSKSSAPLSVAASGVPSIPGAVRRPVSFVRALEMSDQLAGAVPAGRPRQQQVPPRGGGLQTTVEEEERPFGSSYEIAVWCLIVVDISGWPLVLWRPGILCFVFKGAEKSSNPWMWSVVLSIFWLL